MSTTLTNAPPAPPAPPTPAEIARYLEYACELLIKRRKELIDALQADAQAHPLITDDETLGQIAENIRMANLLINKTAKERHGEHKAPYLIGGRAVDGWFKTWAEPLEAAMAPIQRTMNAYGAHKLEQERAKAIAARKQAEAEAEAAQLAAVEALRHGAPHVASDALDRAAETAQVAEDAAARAHARPAELTRTYGTFGAVASVRQKWGWKVTDFAAVPREFLMLDEDKVKFTAKRRDPSGKPIAEIPGITWVASTSVGVR